jgi:hypothetical protein
MIIPNKISAIIFWEKENRVIANLSVEKCDPDWVDNSAYRSLGLVNYLK